jgi:hypothetical protein
MIKLSCKIVNWKGYGNLGFGNPNPETAKIKTKLVVIRADKSNGAWVVGSAPKELLLEKLPLIIKSIDEFINDEIQNPNPQA